MKRFLYGLLALAMLCTSLTQTTILTSAKEATEDDGSYFIIQESKKAGALPRIFLKRKVLEKYTENIGEQYNLPPELLQAIAERESSLDVFATNGKCCGLMQVSTKWHADRMDKLNVENIYDPYDNILVSADYLDELLRENEDDLGLTLMIYNGSSNAYELHAKGELTPYASGIINRMNTLIEEHQKIKPNKFENYP